MNVMIVMLCCSFFVLFINFTFGSFALLYNETY